jgi:uncharacterized membrane protein YbhN (UPF0104 family)
VTKRILPAIASAALAIFLVVLLFRVHNITLGDIGDALATTPPWLLAAVFALTFGNQLAGVARWRAATTWLSPATPRMNFAAMLEATTWGAFLGQLIPPQFSMAFARWAVARNGAAVGVTLYEGLFDFVILGSGALAALAVFTLGLGASASLALFLFAILLGCLSVRWVMKIGHVFTARLAATQMPGAGLAARVSAPLERASRAPAGILATLSVWSFARMALLALRTVVIARAFLPGAHWTTVMIGYPVVGLAVSVPFLPGGLGLVEWSWTGLLVLAGAGASAAALAALVFRIINFLAICGVVLVTTAIGRLSRATPPSPAGAPQS